MEGGKPALQRRFVAFDVVLESDGCRSSCGMGGWDGVSGRDCGSLCGLHRRTDEGNRTCGSGGAAARLLRGASGDGGTAQCGADGGGDGASGGFCAASETPAFRCECAMVG